MDWLTKGWDQGHYISAAVGLVAGVVLVLLGFGGLAELSAPLLSVIARWSMWQIPPPGRSRAQGTPPDGVSRLVQLAVAVLLFTLVLEVIHALAT